LLILAAAVALVGIVLVTSRGGRSAAARLPPGLRSTAASLRTGAASRPKLATPGGLGAIEAALVAGLSGVAMHAGPAVSAVLTYRLATHWLPIVPGWLSWRFLQKREYV
jgi:undecaprenyl-diphosphatase